MVLSLAQRVRSVRVGHTCGYMDNQGVLYSLVPSGVPPDANIFILVHLVRCSIVFEPLFNQIVPSLFPCDLFVGGERTGETGQTTVDNQTTFITIKLRQTSDEIHVQQRVGTVDQRQTGKQSPVTEKAFSLLA